MNPKTNLESGERSTVENKTQSCDLLASSHGLRLIYGVDIHLARAVQSQLEHYRAPFGPCDAVTQVQRRSCARIVRCGGRICLLKHACIPRAYAHYSFRVERGHVNCFCPFAIYLNSFNSTRTARMHGRLAKSEPTEAASRKMRLTRHHFWQAPGYRA